MKQKHLTLKVFSLIILNDTVDTIAQLFMKKGLVATGISSVTFSNLTEFIAKSASSFFLWLGVIFYGLNFLIWIIILYKVDLSIAMPVGSSSYILVPIMAIIFLHEYISPLQWVGVLCIVVGVHFVSQSKSCASEAS
jgi:drug/metabolite transporter (DMT)-like permease